MKAQIVELNNLNDFLKDKEISGIETLPTKINKDIYVVYYSDIKTKKVK